MSIRSDESDINRTTGDIPANGGVCLSREFWSSGDLLFSSQLYEHIISIQAHFDPENAKQ